MLSATDSAVPVKTAKSPLNAVAIEVRATRGRSRLLLPAGPVPDREEADAPRVKSEYRGDGNQPIEALDRFSMIMKGFAPLFGIKVFVIMEMSEPQTTVAMDY